MVRKEILEERKELFGQLQDVQDKLNENEKQIYLLNDNITQYKEVEVTKGAVRLNVLS